MTLTPQKIAKLRRFEGLFNLSTGTAVQAANELIEALPDMLDAADKLARLTAILDELRPLEAAATRPRWEAHGTSIYIPGGGFNVSSMPNARENAALIPAARNALAEMLRAVGS